jgi:PAS domain S-box-containing protein
VTKASAFRISGVAIIEDEPPHRPTSSAWRQIVDSAIDTAIVSVDKAGRVETWSAGAERLLGWSEPEMLGRSLDCLFVAEDRAGGRLAREMADALAHGQGREVRFKRGGHAADKRPGGLADRCVVRADPANTLRFNVRRKSERAAAGVERHQAKPGRRLIHHTEINDPRHDLLPKSRLLYDIKFMG